MYYRRSDGKFEAMVTDVKMYYFGAGYHTVPFPQGMRIVTGTAMSRAKDYRSHAQWVCQTSTGRVGTNGQIPNPSVFPQGCNNIMMTLDFPSCGWANGSLDSWDHFSHMMYPVHQGAVTEYEIPNPYGMVCPPSHPIRYPAIRMEAFYYARDTQPRHDNGPNYVLANGDVVGTTGHADYISNWDQDALRQAISQCTYGRGTGDGTNVNCPPLTNSVNTTISRNCRHAGKIPSEDVGLHDAIDQLPGCNPLWTAEMGDKKPTDCPWYKGDPGWTAPNVYYVNQYPGYNPLPDALVLPPGDTNMTRANLLKYKPAYYKAENTGDLYGEKGYFSGWDEYTKDKTPHGMLFYKWSNKVLVGTNAEVIANRYGCNATDKTGTGPTAGMTDATAFTGVQPACKTDPSLWSSNVKKQPNETFAVLPPGPIHPACGTIPRTRPRYPTNGYYPGPAVEIKSTPNGPDPYRHDYSWYGSGFMPTPAVMPQWKNGAWTMSPEDFAAGKGSPAPGFNGTLVFSPPKTVKYSCATATPASAPKAAKLFVDITSQNDAGGGQRRRRGYRSDQ